MASSPTPPRVKGLNCPNCGAGIELRGLGRSVSVVCIQCLSVIDAQDPSLKIIQQFTAKERVMPKIPLGARGKLHGAVYEVIGFQVRAIEVDGVEYAWHEYVLFNPYKGYRYLSEYQGHWNDIVVLKAIPQSTTSRGSAAASYLGATYRHFQTAQAKTSYVMGEFPWRVEVGDVVEASDYVAPPRMLSSESAGNEITWSLGEYMAGAQVWQAFGLQGHAPPAIGVFANQPSPYAGKPGRIWRTCILLMILLFSLMLGFSVFSGNQVAFQSNYRFDAAATGEKSFVTPAFDLKGRESNVEVEIATDLENNWAFFNMALINEQTGETWDFGREVSYYHGRDSDGNWSEGGRRDRTTLPSIPSGKYSLRVEPEMDTQAAMARLQSMRYQITVRRDVPSTWFFWVVAVLLLVPPVFVSIRAASFEGTRWAESDTGSGSGSSGGDE